MNTMLMNNSVVIYYLLGCDAIGAYVLEQPAD